MNKSETLFQILKERQLIALLSPKSPQECIDAYDILTPLGVTLEIAFRTSAAEEGVQTVLERYPDALILAGTVMTLPQAKRAINAGVAGIVSADYIPAVVQTAAENDILCAPGGLGDVGKQLVQKAEIYGCDLSELKVKHPYQWLHKVFPAVAGSHPYYHLAKAWKGPFKDLNVVYTGGISTSNLIEVAAFDPYGIFCGSALTKSIDNPKSMKENAKHWLGLIERGKTQ